MTIDERTQAFLNWLHDNGAKFDKIEWPSDATASGIRGAIAIEDINTNEHMISIPARLMLSPPIAYKDPDIGLELRVCDDVLRGDLLMTVFCAFELSKGTDSFYYPYLAILPEPGTISEWIDNELYMLQDDKLALRAKRRRLSIKDSYVRTMTELNKRYPTKFTFDAITQERFLFAWYTLQARAFGRRLPWTALVPFADCLNHSNVQTKYDYNIDENSMFRLFPTGMNYLYELLLTTAYKCL